MKDQLISLDENMKVTIVNRKKSYEISKQKLSSIPYFVKLFSNSNCDTTKIELDLDESSFDNIIEFILDGHLSISIESAFLMMETADYLGMGEIKQKSFDFYQSNFNIKLLEKFLDFYENHKCIEKINEEKLNSFIRKYFFPISHTKAFLEFPVTLLERLLKMDLVVSSEFQLFEAIDRWVEFDKKLRKQYFPRLTQFINFRKMKKAEIYGVGWLLRRQGLTSDIPLYSEKYPPRACLPEFCQFDCIINRHYNKSLISIYELDEDKINIRRLSSSNLWTKYGQFTRDETMSTSLIEADHIVDIIYDSGRKGIRVDLIGKKFKYLEMFGGDNSYYGQAYNYFAHDIQVDNTYVKIQKSQKSDKESSCKKLNMPFRSHFAG
ncbi:kelch-like protein 3 [Panonychus citri]|uniref:kelch-like protein 3 n=1 Tax=Panonychus citri TaxID=50023 RepID=UPI002307041C|nr:kelch-like protein 3 [Panonychus citri]